MFFQIPGWSSFCLPRYCKLWVLVHFLFFPRLEHREAPHLLLPCTKVSCVDWFGGRGWEKKGWMISLCILLLYFGDGRPHVSDGTATNHKTAISLGPRNYVEKRLQDYSWRTCSWVWEGNFFVCYHQDSEVGHYHSITWRLFESWYILEIYFVISRGQKPCQKHFYSPRVLMRAHWIVWRKEWLKCKHNGYIYFFTIA